MTKIIKLITENNEENNLKMVDLVLLCLVVTCTIHGDTITNNKRVKNQLKKAKNKK